MVEKVERSGTRPVFASAPKDGDDILSSLRGKMNKNDGKDEDGNKASGEIHFAIRSREEWGNVEEKTKTKRKNRQDQGS